MTTIPVIQESMSANNASASFTAELFTDIPLTTVQAYEEDKIEPVDQLDIYMITVGLLGILDNGFALVVAVFYCNIGKTLTGLLIIHQTIIDLVTSCLVFVQHLVFLSGRNGLDIGNKLLEDLYCCLWHSGVVLWGTLLASSFNLVAVSIERYLAIVWPVFHKTHVSRKIIVPTVVTVWVAGMLFPVLWSIVYTHIENGVCLVFDFDNDTIALFYACSSFSLYYTLPLACFIFCYGQMVFVHFKKPQTKTHGKASKSLLRTLFLVTVAFVLCWTWGQFDWLMISVGALSSFSYGTLYYANMCTYISILINPIIYMAQYKQFQRGMRSMCCKIKVHPVQSTGDGAVP